jgi:hypothetical protein
LEGTAGSPKINRANRLLKEIRNSKWLLFAETLMISARRFAHWRWVFLAALTPLSFMHLSSQADAGAAKPDYSIRPELPDGQHDFDFSIGTWRTHISRRLHPLSGSDEWADYAGSSVVHPIWNGRGSLGETEADGPAGHLEALSLRLYSPQSHQWSLYYASSGGTTSIATELSVPTIGEFRNGRGEFFDTELFHGRNILVRNVWSKISSQSIRFEQAFSEDGGRTWEVNWIAVDTRVDAASAGSEAAGLAAVPGQHDFDFELGTWKTHLRVLLHPLTGSTTWAEFHGTSVVHKIWNGRANMVELEVDGPSGHVEALSLRLYNPESHQWSLNVANGRTGTVGGPPTIGEFRNGRGEFYDMEPINGKSVLVQNVWSDITADSCHFEQAYSADGGKTWEVNWIADDTRVKDESDWTR